MPAMHVDPGVPCWFTLITPDLEASREFYGPLLDWEFEEVGPGVALARRNGMAVAEFVQNRDDELDQAVWSVHFLVDNLAVGRRLLEQAGAEPVELMSSRGPCVAGDVHGTGVSFIQADDPFLAAGEPGTLVWCSLLLVHTRMAMGSRVSTTAASITGEVNEVEVAEDVAWSDDEVADIVGTFSELLDWDGHEIVREAGKVTVAGYHDGVPSLSVQLFSTHDPDMELALDADEEWNVGVMGRWAISWGVESAARAARIAQARGGKALVLDDGATIMDPHGLRFDVWQVEPAGEDGFIHEGDDILGG